MKVSVLPTSCTKGREEVPTTAYRPLPARSAYIDLMASCAQTVTLFVSNK